MEVNCSLPRPRQQRGDELVPLSYTVVAVDPHRASNDANVRWHPDRRGVMESVPNSTRHVRMARSAAVFGGLLVFLAGTAVIVLVSTSTPLASTSELRARNLTLSFDARHPYSEWDGIQPGFACANGEVDRSSPVQSLAAAFVLDDSPGDVRHGRYSARVVLKPGDYAAYTCKAEAVFAIKRLGEGEGSESWWGWSWKLPVGWRGTNSWGMLFEFTPNASLWPSYGMLNFDAATRNSLRLGLHTGLTPSPGSDSYNAAYEKWVTLLGPRAPRPMVYGRWLDFYMHVVWRSHTNGLLEIWYRVEGQNRFTKLYSDVRGASALIHVRPHPTLLYNTENGAPGEDGKPGLDLEGGFYRGTTRWANTYWWDGMRRRLRRASVLAGFPSQTSTGVTVASNTVVRLKR
jgi:Polysaccharide lyase